MIPVSEMPLLGATFDGPGVPTPLCEALLESRQRWQDLVLLSADLAFETDAWGRIVFIAPDPVLGWPAGALLGKPAQTLLATPVAEGGFDPFRPGLRAHHRRVWLRRGDGSSVCLCINTSPMLDGSGGLLGSRGLGMDITEDDAFNARIAAGLRRAELVDHILYSVRQEVLAPRMIQAALSAILRALGAESAAVIETPLDRPSPEGIIRHIAGPEAPMAVSAGLGMIASGETQVGATLALDGRPVLACGCDTRLDHGAALLVWRPPGGRSFDADEQALLAAAAGIVHMALDHESVQREMVRQARTDPLTGLYNRRAFLEELDRRVERLEQENLPGTLMFVDLDNFKALNDRHGHEAGDEALRGVTALLRATFRPTDLLARLGGDEFAIWLDGADELAAAERAEMLRLRGPRTLAEIADGAPEELTLSIGIATHWPGMAEDIDSLLHRADQTMYEVKRSGRGHWRVARSGGG